MLLWNILLSYKTKILVYILRNGNNQYQPENTKYQGTF